MRLEGRRAVRAHDPKVLDPVVVSDPVDVVEDQRHSPSGPKLALSAELAYRCLETGPEQPLLQLPAREGRSFDQDLIERPFREA
jgi:hypothetical protein